MLVRFLKSGPVKAGPGRIHGLPGQLADLSDSDLESALADGAVEIAEPEPAGKPAAKAKRGA
jgi:hypothetical protein